ncbi:hypothetical protein [Caudoviricetes sp.]|nr:hypothetical protein [Caudoviricetes sp.]
MGYRIQQVERRALALLLNPLPRLEQVSGL